MIYDKLENIGRYKGMNKHLDTAIDYILHNDLSSLPSGRTELDGDNVYINVMEAAAGLWKQENMRFIRNIWIYKSISPARKPSIPET